MRRQVNRLFILFISLLFLPLSLQSQSTELKRWIPYTLPWDDMPIDLSFIYAKEKPAGKHGFLQVKGDKFVFEDGTEARFWGTNFNSAQNFPSHEHSEKVAKRLAKIGVNIVRFHQLDAEWSTPNIFQFTKGENKPNTMSFDPESMDRLDYLIYCLKKEGIYVYMDLLTYRRFKTGDGVESAHRLGDAAKPYSTYNRRLIELQKKFNSDLWNHVNPYTQLAYKDDPAIALVDVANENDFYTWKVELEPYRSELENLYREWAKSQGVSLGEEKVLFDKSDKFIQQFFMKVTEAYYREMIDDMRDIGVVIPITGSNLHGDWSRRWGHLSSQMNTDFTDSHAYSGGGGRWLDKSGRFGNKPNLGHADNMLPALAINRVHGKPFFVSEWDNPWPNEWRAESSLLMAACASFQGWGGLAIHTYRYTLSEDVDMIGKSIRLGAIGGSFYRGGVFDTFNDPAKFGLFYHAALMFRRGDVKNATKIVAITADEPFRNTAIKALILTPEKHRVETVLPGMNFKGDITVKPEEEVVDIKHGEVLSDTKELYRNLNERMGWIDSPKTKAVYGFVGKEGEILLNDVKVEVKTDFATVAISSLTDEPIKSSGNMLLTAVGRAENTNSKYNEDRTVLLDPGHGPIQVEVIDAIVEIKTDKRNLRVMSINPQGSITGYMPSEYKDGTFRFEIGKEFQSIYYLIQEL
ncbi:MAG: hypothetical protein ACOX19_12030 [Fermentimonas sp.]